MAKEYGVYAKPNGGGFAERTWFKDRRKRDAAYDRLKKDSGPGKRYLYVKKMERG